MKEIVRLTIEDLMRYPVWEFDTESAEYGQFVFPILDLPVAHLNNRIVGTQVTLSCGAIHWSKLGGIALNDQRSTNHFLNISIERDGKWFHLGRYFDADYVRRGPLQLAEFVGLSADDVFPIIYDISGVAQGHPLVTKGAIPLEASERLAQTELVKLAIASSA